MSALKVTYLKDYRPPDFEIQQVALLFELDPEVTLVEATFQIRRRGSDKKVPLVLDGENAYMRFCAAYLEGVLLTKNQWEQTDHSLTIKEVPDQFSLKIVTEVYPRKNTSLQGLYCSHRLFCTQCEAEGFRNITYYLDRPDVMAPFTTTIVADKAQYPVLLSNGNRIEEGQWDEQRHWVKWEDPFKKPSYLFALVAGDLAQIKDTFVTCTGRSVSLEMYVEPPHREQCDYAMASLKRAMQWDEVHYGREYDLDIYMIVAVHDFNMGAMENKGLNIFNAKYVLAEVMTATDEDLKAIEAVIGHEYFHNWSGNRVTCRDWFQLSLKEGLTVFREQQFCESLGQATVKRMREVAYMRARQFAEDSGPMAHPVQPKSYVTINNFYTATVYNKGAEVIRMLPILLGEEGFRRGMDCYFTRHDGQAVTIEDFIRALSDATGKDLTDFMHWYHQAGTPIVTCTGHYDAGMKRWLLHMTQERSVKVEEKRPLVIPIRFALYDKEGHSLPFRVGEGQEVLQRGSIYYLLLSKWEQTFVFEEVPAYPIPSLLGYFSAPIKLHYPATLSELSVLVRHDKEGWNRWDAAQQLGISVVRSLMRQEETGEACPLPEEVITLWRALVRDRGEPAMQAELLEVPSYHYISEDLPETPILALITARRALLEGLARALETDFAACYDWACKGDDGSLSQESMGFRALKNVCLHYLVLSGSPDWLTLVEQQYHKARTMTERLGALQACRTTSPSIREALLKDFYEKGQHDPLIVNKWLSLHALSEHPNTLEVIRSLLTHPAFDKYNPNKVYALIGTFGASNFVAFHKATGEGYDFIAKEVLGLQRDNPQVAARLVTPLTYWKRWGEPYRTKMKQALGRIAEEPILCKDVAEIVTKSLA